MKKNDTIFILSELTFGCQQVNFPIFPNLIRQPAAIAKTKI